MLVDTHQAKQTPFLDARGRSIRYLRLSLTDRCNYSCAYCRPVGEWLPADRPELLTLEELVRFASWMVEGGVRKIRLTGGEPLLRKGVVSLVGELRKLSGLEELVMTTNGHLLTRFAKPLFNAGLDRLNVSLDTLNADRFGSLTGGCLKTVLDGIDAALSAGFRYTRINAVLLREVSSSERTDLLEYCWSRDMRVAFIEMMPIGALAYQQDLSPVTRDALVTELTERYGLSESPNNRQALSGPVNWYTVTDGPFVGKQVGTISPMTDHHFCETCNRARLTARGGFRGCLGNDDEVQLLHMVRRDEKELCMQRVKDALNHKRDGHLMGEVGFVPLSVMTGIGG